jgi:hypothetical protein
MSDNKDWSDTLEQVAEYAQLFGQGAAISVVQDMLRGQVTQLLQSYGAEDVESYVLVGTPIVRKKAPTGFKDALKSVGPKFFNEIQMFVTPERILEWLETADEWLTEEDVEQYTDPDVDKKPEELHEELQEIADVIRETPGGMGWLKLECRDIHFLAAGEDLEAEEVEAEPATDD